MRLFYIITFNTLTKNVPRIAYIIFGDGGSNNYLNISEFTSSSIFIKWLNTKLSYTCKSNILSLTGQAENNILHIQLKQSMKQQ